MKSFLSYLLFLKKSGHQEEALSTKLSKHLTQIIPSKIKQAKNMYPGLLVWILKDRDCPLLLYASVVSSLKSLTVQRKEDEGTRISHRASDSSGLHVLLEGARFKTSLYCPSKEQLGRRNIVQQTFTNRVLCAKDANMNETGRAGHA